MICTKNYKDGRLSYVVLVRSYLTPDLGFPIRRAHLRYAEALLLYTLIKLCSCLLLFQHGDRSDRYISRFNIDMTINGPQERASLVA